MNFTIRHYYADETGEYWYEEVKNGWYAGYFDYGCYIENEIFPTKEKARYWLECKHKDNQGII